MNTCSRTTVKCSFLLKGDAYCINIKVNDSKYGVYFNYFASSTKVIAYCRKRLSNLL